MSAVNFPLTTTTLFVDSSSTNKLIYLPAISSVAPGRLFHIKDVNGNSANYPIYIFTSGTDFFENSTTSNYILINTNYGSVLLVPDGSKYWYILQYYTTNLVT